MWSYRSHLEERDPIYVDDWSHNPFIRRFYEVFLSCKVNTRRSAHSPQDHFIITLIISDWRDWCDTWGKWPLGRILDRSWWHCHTSLKVFFCSPWHHGQDLKPLQHIFKCVYKVSGDLLAVYWWAITFRNSYYRMEGTWGIQPIKNIQICNYMYIFVIILPISIFSYQVFLKWVLTFSPRLITWRFSNYINKKKTNWI